jgi:hypothetical protein
MPNHVSHICTVRGPAADLAAFRGQMFKNNDEGERLDFEGILPMPQCLKDSEEAGSLTGNVLSILVEGPVVEAWEALQRFDHGKYLGPWKGYFGFGRDEIRDRLERAFPGCIAKARHMATCIGETGFKSWYPWSIETWGTKWNAYQTEILEDSPGELRFSFQTAWSFPAPVFAALARVFPSLNFDLVCFDEGWNFAGRGAFNPTEGQEPFATCDANTELFEAVYGHAPEIDEGDEVKS